MCRKIDLTGKRFERLTVLSENPEKTKWGHRQWNCVCDCGTQIVVAGYELNIDNKTSCGCIESE